MSSQQLLTCAMQKMYGSITINPEYIQIKGGSPKADNLDEEVKSLHPKLSFRFLNFLNLFFYIANVVVCSGVIAFPRSIPDISLKYQTLVTPIDWSFSIWAVIFGFQLVWAVLQLNSKFRAHPYVRKGVSYWYIGVCTTQIIWAFVFAYDLIWLSLLFISLIALTLAACVIGSYNQYSNANKSLIEFWFLLFPFSIHFSWLLCATLVNANVVVVWAKANAVTQITVAICSLVMLNACGIWALFVPARPNYTVPTVISWATLGVYFRLDKPIPLISSTFDSTVILSVQYSSLVICLLMIFFISIRLSVVLNRSRFAST